MGNGKPGLLLAWGVGVVGALTVLAVSPGASHAGENLIGRILASDAGSANNFNTGYLTAGCLAATDPNGGSCNQSFRVPVNAKLTIQCDQAAIIEVNQTFTDAGTGTVIAAAQMFPTSTGTGISYTGIGGRTDDAGTYFGGMVAIAPAVGASSVLCRVSTRSGTE